jgi:hypothetical protein
MTTSLVVERSEPGYGLPPALSFKDVHHPRWGGRRAKLGPCLPHGLVTHFFLPHLEEKDVHQPCGGGELWLRGAGRLQAPSAATCLAPWLGWIWCRFQRCLLPPSRVWTSIHRTGDGRAVRRSAAPVAPPARPAMLLRRRRGVVQDVIHRGGGGHILGWSCPHPCRRTGARASSPRHTRFGGHRCWQAIGA